MKNIHYVPKDTIVYVHMYPSMELLGEFPTEFDWLCEMEYPPVTDGLNENVFVPHNGFIISTKKENLRKLN